MRRELQPLVTLLDWRSGRMKSGFLCGYYPTEAGAVAAQQLIEYYHGKPARIVRRVPSRRRPAPAINSATAKG